MMIMLEQYFELRGISMVGGKAAAEAGAVTHGAVRCSLSC